MDPSQIPGGSRHDDGAALAVEHEGRLPLPRVPQAYTPAGHHFEQEGRLPLLRVPQACTPAGHHFERSTASDNARVQYGDQHHHHYARPSGPSSAAEEQAEALKNLQKSLSFPEMNLRFISIETAYSQTCQWFFKAPEYKRWRDLDLQQEHHGLLWVKGKTGAGKSVITKCALEYARATYTNERTIYFFFNARGGKLEQTMEGMFRSLLHQMAPEVPWLLEAVPGATTGENSQQVWSLELLRGLFREAACRLCREGRLNCYIDAVDEGADMDEIRDMVNFFEDLLEIVLGGSGSLSVYLASRHYPNVHVSHREELILDNNENHHGDIAVYTRSKLRCKPPALKEDLIAKIIQRSSGVFLWVVLVVRDLNKESDEGGQHLIQSRLETIPNGLNALFQRIVDDSNQHERMLPTLLWVLFAGKALSPLELYFAILTSTHSGLRTSIMWDREIVDEESATKFVLSSSQGLLEIVPHDRISQEKSVQFIHESVREFLLSTMSRFDPTLRRNVVGHSNLRLARWCGAYLKFAFGSDAVRRFETSDVRIEQVFEQLPFLLYALAGVLLHSERAASQGIVVDLPFDEILRLSPWVRLVFGLKHFVNPPTILHVLVQQGYAKLVEQHLESYDRAGLHDYINEPYLGYITRSTRSPVNRWLRVFMRGNIRGTPLQIALSSGRDVARLLLNYGADINITCKGMELPLHIEVVRSENEDMLKLLLEHHADVNATDIQGATALDKVVKSRNIGVVRLLLQAGADVNASITDDHTALHTAVGIQLRSTEMVEVLLQHGANPNARNGDGNTALHHLYLSGENRVVGMARMLLQYGADPSARNYVGNTALYLATRNPISGHETTELLLQHGADYNARNDEGDTPLHRAAAGECGCFGVTERLLACGADANARNEHGTTPLLNASAFGGVDEVEALLGHCADATVSDVAGFTPLMFAIRRKDINMARILLTHGADVYTQIKGQSNMDLAMKLGKPVIIQLLMYFADIPLESRHEAARTLEDQEWWKSHVSRDNLWTLIFKAKTEKDWGSLRMHRGGGGNKRVGPLSDSFVSYTRD
ncbi:hypothetical protein Q7P37_000131 [Cladosporium fusiforme]